MPAQVNPRGFHPVRNLRGDNHFRTKMYHRPGDGVAADASFQVFPGDPMRLGANGVPVPVTAGDAVLPVIGVVACVYNSNKRPRTHSLPDGNAFLGASVEGYLSIWDDPDTVFQVECDTSVLEPDIGANIDVTIGSPTTATNTSGYKAQTIGTGATAACRIVGLSPFEIEGDPPGSDYGGNNRDIEVVFINQNFRTNAGI